MWNSNTNMKLQFSSSLAVSIRDTPTDSNTYVKTKRIGKINIITILLKISVIICFGIIHILSQ